MKIFVDISNTKLSYEYFEDDDNISPNGDINNGTSYQQPKQQNYSFVW